MKKVVINKCFGGFGLSEKAEKRYCELWCRFKDIKRDDHILIRVVEEMGREADGDCAELKVVEIPDDVEFTIEEYDGMEHIAEVHRTWE